VKVCRKQVKIKSGSKLFGPIFCLAGSAFALCASPAALAQTGSTPPAPSPLPSRDEFDLEPVKPLTDAPKLEISGDIERAPCALADPAYSAIKFTFSEANFNNLGPVSAAELRETYAGMIGRELPIAAVCDIRDGAATLLRKRGYLAAVEVPVQRIENGVVNFEVLYGKLTAIRVQGEPGSNAGLLENMLGKLVTGQPFNRYDAERHLLLAREIPGYQMRLTLKPTGATPGDLIGEVALKRTPVEADFSFQNFAPRDTGRFGGQLRVQFNGLTGMGDRTTFSLFSTADFKEQQIAQASHETYLGSSGLRLAARVNYAWSKPSLGAGFPDVKADTLFASSELSYPFILRQAGSLRGAVGLDYVNQKVDFGGLPLSRDRLRTAFVRIDAEAADREGIGPGGSVGWRFGSSIEARRGLDLWNASPNCVANRPRCVAAGFVPPSLLDGDPTPTIFRGAAFADIRVIRNLSVALQARGQTSKSALPAFEQFSLGNYTIGRGYDPGASVGDQGAGFTSEIRIDNVRLSESGKFRLQPYLFVENAWSWNRGDGLGSEKVGSVGGGLRLNLADKIRIDAAVAVPTVSTRGFNQRGKPRFLISFSTNLFPWRTR
jgi:hemolysin activation/secretion protein